MSEVKRMRNEHLDDVIEDERGARRRGDFDSEEEWQNGAAVKAPSAPAKTTTTPPAPTSPAGSSGSSSGSSGPSK